MKLANGHLTSREVEIVKLLAKGMKTREIAERSDRSVLTVKSQLRTIFKKLGVHNRTSAVLKSLGLGILKETGLFVDGVQPGLGQQQDADGSKCVNGHRRDGGVLVEPATSELSV